MSNPYWDAVKDNLPRFLAQLDCNPLSKTYGCFDRSYWHQRRADFPSAALQQGALVLAQLYCFKNDKNPFFGNKEILKLISGALEFTFKIQHADGSMDEWYPQERGWAGPTGYVLYAVIRSLELVGSELDDNLKITAKRFSERAVHHLMNYEEADILSNHQAMSLLAVTAARRFFSIAVSQDLISAKEKKFNSSFASEGWSLEYDGCDPGYQSATLSFLSRLYRVSPDENLKNLCLEQINFLKNFIFPDFSFAGSMGSRGTGNVFHFGFEFWARENTDAKYLADLTLAGLSHGTVLHPSDQEDHYLIYRLLEFAECAAIFIERPLNVNWSAKSQTGYLPQSGMYIISNSDHFGILNLKKGGAGKLFQLNPVRLLHQDSGYWIEDESGNLYVSSYVRDDRKITMTQEKITIESSCNKFKRPVFNQFNFLLFRGVLFFVRNSFLALHLKKWIRSKVMTGFSSFESIQFKRSIILGPSEISIRDQIQTKGSVIKRAFRGVSFPARAVPQSLYVTKNELGRAPFTLLDESTLKTLNSDGTAEIRVL